MRGGIIEQVGNSNDLQAHAGPVIDLAGDAWDPLAALVFCGPSKAAYKIINRQVVVANGTLQTMDKRALLSNHQMMTADLMQKSRFA